MDNRITRLIEKSNRKLLVPFLTAGYPKKSTFLDLIKASINSGSDMIEIGIPFSDPLADGPQVQLSSFVALRNGIKLKDIFSLVEQIRKFSEIPLVLMGYYNPILAYGENSFYYKANTVGVDGLIIPDLPIDEGLNYKQSAEKNGFSAIFLAAPTSSDERIKIIGNFSTDIVYAVTVAGVTGVGKVFDRSTDNYLKNLKKLVNKKVIAGFGVSSADDAKRLARHTDGVVVGSALIKIMRANKNNRVAVNSISKMLTGIRKAI